MLEPRSRPQVKAMCDKWDRVLYNSHGRLGDLFADIMSTSKYGTWSCIIDGLDHCKMSEREMLLQNLDKGFKAKNSAWNLKLLIISRPCKEIKTKIRSWETAKIQTFVDEKKETTSQSEKKKTSSQSKKKETLNQCDIFKYIEKSVEDFHHYSSEQKKSTVETLKQEANGSFEWVVHLIQALKNSLPDWDFRPLTIPLPAMDEASKDLIDRANSERLALLQMLAVMERDLPYKAFTEIVRIRESPFPNCFDIGGKADTIDLSILLCEEALQVQNGHLHLVHPTLKEYIRNHMTEPEFHEIHRKVAKTCLLYLATIGVDRHPLPKSLPEECPEEYIQFMNESPYLDYAATFWSYHVENAGRGHAMLLGDMVHRTFQIKDVRDLASQVHLFGKSDEYIGGQSLLHILVQHRLVSLTEQLLASENTHEISPNHRDDKGRTALWWAVENDSKEMVRLLLKTPGIILDSPDQDDVSPALNAVIRGNIDILRLFLDTGKVTWNQKNKTGRTLLESAAVTGRRHVVEELLRSDSYNSKEAISPDQTALVLAARKGFKPVVELLLEYKADPNSLGTVSGRSALSWAAGNGYQSVVAVLLEKQNVELEQPDSKFQRTAFHWAGHNENRDIARMILQEIFKRHGNRAGDTAQKLLFEAATKGQVVALEVLLESGQIDPDCQVERRTPLSLAAEHGQDKIIDQLLKSGKVNINSKDAQHMTPLIYAAKEGCSEVAKVLLAQSDIDIYARDSSQRTAKEWAEDRSREEILKLINDRETLLRNSRATTT